MKPIKIFICDDHPLVIQGLELSLADNPQYDIVGKAYNGRVALEKLSDLNVDILLLDVNMPVLNGLETCKLVHRQFPTINILMLSMLNDLYILKKLIENGARGYLLKNSSREEITEAIDKVTQGELVFDADMIAELQTIKSIRQKKRDLLLFPSLSRREKEILTLIIEEYTTAEIAEKLFIGFSTVETHRRNMLNKLGLKNTAGLVRMALEFNLLER